jgi:hypothetical protein
VSLIYFVDSFLFYKQVKGNDNFSYFGNIYCPFIFIYWTHINVTNFRLHLTISELLIFVRKVIVKYILLKFNPYSLSSHLKHNSANIDRNNLLLVLNNRFIQKVKLSIKFKLLEALFRRIKIAQTFYRFCLNFLLDDILFHKFVIQDMYKHSTKYIYV